MQRFKKFIYHPFVYTGREPQGRHPFGMFLTGFERVFNGSFLNIRTEQGRRIFQFFRDSADKLAVFFRLALTHMPPFKRKPVVGGGKYLSGSFSPFFIAHPLRGDSFTSVSGFKTAVANQSGDGTVVYTPKLAEVADTALLAEVPEFHGITDIHSFNGFHSFYRFLRKTFFHTRYVLVTDKDTKSVSMPVYNLSVANDESYVIPLGIVHNCRCTVVQVRKGKYPVSDETEAMNLGSQATAGKYQEMFMFNPGKRMTCFPAYNGYTIRKCNRCSKRPDKMQLAADIPDNELCKACRIVQGMKENGYIKDKEYGDRLLISKIADKSELDDNIRAAKALLRSFPEMEMAIRGHILKHNVSNPEYLINGLVADRKGIESEKGIASGFNKAMKQGCKIVVVDLDMHPEKFPILRTRKLSSEINNRHADFEEGKIKECYVIFKGKAVRIGADVFLEKQKRPQKQICSILEKIKSD